MHGLPSSQVVTEPGRQAIPWHTSPTVHASESLQVVALAKCTQPLWPKQASSLQGLPSSHVPSSVLPLQSSSMPLQISVLGAHRILQTLWAPLGMTSVQTPTRQSDGIRHGQPRAPPHAVIRLVSGAPPGTSDTGSLASVPSACGSWVKAPPSCPSPGNVSQKMSAVVNMMAESGADACP